MRRNLVTKSFLVATILALLFTFIQLPYYVTKPGMAQELEPFIDVEGGFEEEGSFMLTTVRMGKANVFSYLWAKLDKYHMIYPIEQIRREGESDEEYTYRQLHLMEGSKESAISVAYRYANKPVSYTYHGVYVTGVVKGMSAEKNLKPGDRIFKVNDNEIQTAEEFIGLVSEMENGDQVEVTFEREDKEQEALLTVQPFPEEPDRVGVGISLVTDKEIVASPTINIDTEKIGGPSAGLMFTLEIYNQLTENDITHGLKIAGTGSITDNGEVGRIGGISQKIVAADKSGVEIFFAPNELGSPTSNYQEALKTAKEINSDMNIVPVDTFEDALTYLEDYSN